MSIVVSQAVAEDATILTALAYKTFWDAFAHHPKNAPDDLAHYMRQAFSLEQIKVELADQKNLFLIAEIDGELAGYSKLIFDNIEPGVTAEKPVELSRLYSHQKFLGQGVGQALMDACFERAKDPGCDVMWLGVWEFNPRAQRFYEKNGFYEIGKHTFQLGSDSQTDFLMQKELMHKEILPANPTNNSNRENAKCARIPALISIFPVFFIRVLSHNSREAIVFLSRMHYCFIYAICYKSA